MIAVVLCDDKLACVRWEILMHERFSDVWICRDLGRATTSADPAELGRTVLAAYLAGRDSQGENGPRRRPHRPRRPRRHHRRPTHRPRLGRRPGRPPGTARLPLQRPHLTTGPRRPHRPSCPGRLCAGRRADVVRDCTTGGLSLAGHPYRLVRHVTAGPCRGVTPLGNRARRSGACVTVSDEST